MKAIGIDLGLVSGAAVEITIAASSSLITEVKTLYIALPQKKRKGQTRPLWNASALSIAANFYARVVPPEPMAIGMDWDPRDAFWGNRKSASHKAFLAGFLYARLSSLGHQPMCLTPEAVRDYFNLSPKSPKEEVQSQFEELLSPLVARRAWTEHEVDAALLAYLAMDISEASDGTFDLEGSVPAR